MNERTLLIVLSLAQVCSASAQIRKPDPIGAHPWPMDHANPARTGKTDFPGPATGTLSWSKKIGGPTFGIACDSTGSAILGATFHPEWWDGELYVTRFLATGEIDWKVPVEPYPWGAGQGVASFPSIDSRNVISLNSGKGQVLQFTLSGDLVRTLNRNENSTNNSTPLCLPDGTMYHHQNVIGVAKYGPAGNMIWQIGAGSQTDLALAPNGDVALGGVHILEPHGSIDLTYINANGSWRWIKSSTRGANPQVCFGPDGLLYSGRDVWNPDGTLHHSNALGASFNQLDGLGREISTFSSSISAYNKDTGATVWMRDIAAYGSIVQGVSIDSTNRIYATTTTGYLVCLNSDGTIRWANQLCEEFVSQLSISIKSTGYAVGRTGYNRYFLFRVK